MPSALSSYLLPMLADFSLVRRETYSPAGAVRFTGDAVEVEEIGAGVDLSGLRALFAEAGAGLGSIGALTEVSLGALGRVGLLEAMLTRPLMGTATSAAATIMRAPTETAD